MTNPVTPSEELDLAQIYSDKLKESIEKFKFSQNTLTRKIGISSSIISQILKNEYPYNSTNFVWSAIEKFLRISSKKIYETKLMRIVFRTLNRTYEEKKLSVITGVSGSGKTTALENYCLYNQDAVYIRVNEVLTKKYLLITLLRSLGQIAYGSQFEMFDIVSEILRKRPRLIVIDEAERLKTDMLELLRDLYDQGNMALCLVGLQNLSTILVKGRSLRENLVQLYSRVDYKEIVNILTPDDVRMVFDDYLPKHKVSDIEIRKLAKEYEKRGGIRAIIKIANLAVKLAERNNAKEVNDEWISHATQELDWRAA